MHAIFAKSPGRELKLLLSKTEAELQVKESLASESASKFDDLAFQTRSQFWGEKISLTLRAAYL